MYRADVDPPTWHPGVCDVYIRACERCLIVEDTYTPLLERILEERQAEALERKKAAALIRRIESEGGH